MITKILGREVLDSRGNPTIEAEVHTNNTFARAIAPSGASCGRYEAHELRDGGARFLGKGVLSSVNAINKIISPALIGESVFDQKKLDNKMIELDGTKNKTKLGGNTLTAVSIALLKTAANMKNQSVYQYLGGNTLPIPFFNILNGGKHAGNKLAIQEFLIIPKHSSNFPFTIQMACEIYHTLKKQLVKKYGINAKNVGDEGGFAPPIPTCFNALEEITLAIEECGYTKQIKLGIDAAASSFYNEKTKNYFIDEKILDSAALLDYYLEMEKKYKIISMEDPFYEEDFDNFSILTHKIGSRTQIVGDDLLVTNPKRLETAIEKKSVNALLLKINQIGTVTEALEVADLCKKNKIQIIVSHRSGESEDNFIAQFAVGINAGQIKTGAPARGERTAKYNELLRISANSNVCTARMF